MSDERRTLEVGDNVASALEWLVSESQRVAFGEVGVKLILHEGRIQKVERSVSEKQAVASHDKISQPKSNTGMAKE